MGLLEAALANITCGVTEAGSRFTLARCLKMSGDPGESIYDPSRSERPLVAAAPLHKPGFPDGDRRYLRHF